MATDPVTAPIFVVGTGRSGTTLLRLMLCAHPRIHLTHEASFWLWEAIFPPWRSGDDFLRFYVRTFSYRWLRLDPSTWVGEVPTPLPRGEVHRIFTAVMRAQAARHGKVRWGDKTPSHSGNLARIFRDFPDARVIRIVRDPREVVRSFVRMPWCSGSLVAAAGLCETERKQTEPFRDRILEIRLEDLVEHPREVMARVLEHVGEPWDDAVLDHPRHAAAAAAEMPPVPWFQTAAQAPARRAVHDPASRWDPVDLRLVEHLCRKSLERHGYPRLALPAEPSRWAVFRRWLALLPETLRTLGVALRLTWQARDPDAAFRPDHKALFRRLNPAAWNQWPGLEIPDPPALPAAWEEAASGRRAA